MTETAFNVAAWVGIPWSADRTCLDFAVEASNAITGGNVRNPERDPEVQENLGRGVLPMSVVGGVRLPDGPGFAAPGDIWLLRGSRNDEPLHACVLIDSHTGASTASNARVLELSHHGRSRMLRVRAVERLVVARFRPCS